MRSQFPYLLSRVPSDYLDASEVFQETFMLATCQPPSRKYMIHRATLAGSNLETI